MSLAGRALGVVVLGPAGVELHGDGPLDAAASFHRELGGEGSLAAVVAARAGATTALVTHVGDDPFGRWLIERWEREGIHLDFTREVSRPSTLEVVGTDRRRFAPLPVSQSASATLAPAAVSAIPWELARVLLVTGAAQAAGPEARAAVARAASQAHAAGVRVVYDPTLSTDLWPTASNRAPRRALEELIPSLDTLALSAPYGAGRLLGQPAPEEAAKAALALGVGRVVVREAASRRAPGAPEAPGQGARAPETVCTVAQGGAGSTPLRVAVAGRPTGADGAHRRATFDGTLAAALAQGAALDDATRLALEATLIPMAAAALPSAAELEALRPREAPWR